MYVLLPTRRGQITTLKVTTLRAIRGYGIETIENGLVKTLLKTIRRQLIKKIHSNNIFFTRSAISRIGSTSAFASMISPTQEGASCGKIYQ